MVVPSNVKREVGVVAGTEGRRELSPVMFWRVKCGEK
jgi:hypothetical protein